jgi:hypothetical protein
MAVISIFKMNCQYKALQIDDRVAIRSSSQGLEIKGKLGQKIVV